MSYGGRIAILPGQSKAEEFSTLVHELAHEMLHKAERRSTTTKVVKEITAESNRKAEVLKGREATSIASLRAPPAIFTGAQLRVFLRALVNLDPYTLTDDVAQHFAAADDQQTTEEILASALSETPDEKLAGFALRIALTG